MLRLKKWTTHCPVVASRRLQSERARDSPTLSRNTDRQGRCESYSGCRRSEGWTRLRYCSAIKGKTFLGDFDLSRCFRMSSQHTPGTRPGKRDGKAPDRAESV